MPWIEKYRPSTFDNIVLNDFNRTLFRNIINKGYFPNMLFYGPPGTGKTTTIMNLIHEFQSKWTTDFRNGENVIHLNASDDRGIDIIRLQIQQFVKTSHLFEIGYKFVILDEVDYMTKTAQQSLKTLLQTSRSSVRYCLICNYISKMDALLKQEFVIFRFNQLPQEDIHSFLRNICDKEGLSFTSNQLTALQEHYSSDIRSMLNFLQLHRDGQSDFLANDVWISLNHLMTSTNVCVDDLVSFFAAKSSQSNTDQRSMISKYVKWMIRQKSYRLTPTFFEEIEKIVHASDEIPTELLLHQFFYALKLLF